MFVDATGSLDRLNNQILKLITESPVGGLPLGFIILSEQTESSRTGFIEIKKILLQGAFLGRGIHILAKRVICMRKSSKIYNIANTEWVLNVSLN